MRTGLFWFYIEFTPFRAAAALKGVNRCNTFGPTGILLSGPTVTEDKDITMCNSPSLLSLHVLETAYNPLVALSVIEKL